MISAETWDDELLLAPDVPELVSAEEFRRVGELFPDIHQDVSTLLFIYGNRAFDLPKPGSTYLSLETNFLGLLSRDGSQESVTAVFNSFCGFIRQARHEQGLASFDRLLSELASPELHRVIGILETDVINDRPNTIDEFRLRIAETALRRSIAERNGLTEAQIESGLYPGAKRQYQAALQWLAEDPPLKNGPRKSPDSEFDSRRLQALEFLCPQITELLNAAGHGEFIDNDDSRDRVLINNNVSNVKIDGWYLDEEGEDEVLGVEIFLKDGSSIFADMGSILNMIEDNYSCGHTLGPVNIINLALADSLAWSETIEDFKKTAALTFHGLRSGLILHDYPDHSLFQYSMRELMLEHLILRGANVTLAEINRYDFSAGSESANKNDWLDVHNNDAREGGYRGEVTADNLYKVARGYRMATHSDDYVPLNQTLPKPARYDAELNITLPFDPDSFQAQLIHMPGYTVSGFQLSPDFSNNLLHYCVQYKELDHDPYSLPTIELDQHKLLTFAAKLGRIGLNECADDLLDLRQPTLQSVFDILASHSHYGTGQELVHARVGRVEHLQPFIEYEQLIGTCTVFAAMATFAINDLLPDSQTFAVSGHRIRSGGKVDKDSHAQVGFSYNGRPYITQFSGHAVRKSPLPPERKQVHAEVDYIDVLDSDGQLLSVAQNLRSRLDGLLCNKYDLDQRDQKGLLNLLAKKQPEHFGRRLYGICLRAEKLPLSDTIEFLTLADQISETLKVMDAWRDKMAGNGFTSRKLNDIFGAWSVSEISVMQADLRHLEAAIKAGRHS